MKIPIFFAASILAINAQIIHWENFKILHSKNYNIFEEKHRFEIYQNNLKKIEEHNAKYDAGLETYWLAVNKFADLTTEEFGALLKHQNRDQPRILGSLHVENLTAPESIDWRQNGAVLGVKNQGQCGSCWAFSTTGAIEGQNAILHNKKVALSEQQLLDCSSSYGNGNCEQGGDMIAGFKYVIDHGLENEADYPYTPRQGSCHSSSGKSVVKVKGYKEVTATETALKNAVGTVGPISVAIYAEPIQLYGGGIFKSSHCHNSKNYLDHGVLAVGYSSSPSDYWIIKNSWSSSWGENGYFRLARNADQCGIALSTSYPVL